MTTTPTLRQLEKRLDSLALEQLRQVAAEQQEEIDRLRAELWRAEECAEFWREQALHLEAQITENNPHLAVGMTKTGELLVVQKPNQQGRPS